MEFSILTIKLNDGNYMAAVDWTKLDGGNVGTPGAVKYGDTAESAYNSLEQLLTEKGYTVVAREILKWSDESDPLDGVSSYNHIIAKSPMGEFIIEWKSWKDRPSYDLNLDDKWIGVEYSLHLAKKLAEAYILDKFNMFNEYMKKHDKENKPFKLDDTLANKIVRTMVIEHLL